MMAVIYIRSARPAPHNHSEPDQIPVVTAGISTGAVTTERLADLAVSTTKIADGAVSLAKAHDALKTSLYVGDETEVSVTGITYVDIKSFQFSKDSPGANGLSLVTLIPRAELRADTSGVTATIGFFVDSEATPRLELTANTSGYTVVSTGFTVSDLAVGTHNLNIKLKASTTGVVVYNKMLEVYGRQG
jgi:hypothetical protein